MAGFPFSGKSYVRKLITDELPKTVEVTTIDPKGFRPDDYDTMSEADRREINLDAWSVSLDILHEQTLCTPNKNVIIYDTACASLNAMAPYFKAARQYKQNIYYVYIDARLGTCERRAGESWLPANVIDRYVEKFKESIPELVSLSDTRFIINNDQDSVPDVRKVIETIVSVK